MKVDDKVSWESHGPRGYTVKYGVIVQVVPPGELPRETEFIARGLRFMYGYGREADIGTPRKNESYLVEVPGKTAKAMPKLYWPRVSQLKLQTP